MTANQVLVTGGTGFVASQVIKCFLEGDFFVTASVRNKKNKKKIEPLLSLCTKAAKPAERLQLVEADLLNYDGWEKAVQNCSLVIHVASPFPGSAPKDENEIIKPAVEGTLNVLKAAATNDNIHKVVLTSSVSSISGGFQGGGPFTEDQWTNTGDSTIMAYVKSKTLAERAAWKFVEEQKEKVGRCFDLVTINPSFILGPTLCGTEFTSMEPIKRIIERQMPLLPKLNFSVVDVRDVAKAHFIAATDDGLKNERFILHNENIWMQQLAIILEKEFKWQGYNVPTTVAPSGIVKLVGFFDKTIKNIIPMLEVETYYDNSKMINKLKLQPTPVDQTIIDMAYSMIESGFVKKTSKYRGIPPGSDINCAHL
ncbi:DgyrCDS2940 [Dimorphilus gyrociliatus]|uniref:DgyrCDS2940 n=1 Tax=Dimorphilus gyrociliatus TaxID=2664684 RepID=A0A7I8VDL9_9ANNE|nr:DgyrCDS2940 [Dimorphilus gyrociliatus]